MSAPQRRPRLQKIIRFFFFATLFCVTFEKIHWAIAGSVSIADFLTLGFLLAYLLDRLGRSDGWFPRTSLVVAGFLLAFLLVYLVGYFNGDTAQAAGQLWKGMIKFVIHFLFLVAGVAYLARRTERFYWQALGVFFAGIFVNALYGLVQLLTAQVDFNLDSAFVSPFTGGASAINLYGAVEGTHVYRPNALTGDPNHLAIMLLLPLLVLTPIYLRLERGHPWRRRLSWLLGFLLVMELSTLSRSGLLGLFVGVLILLIPYRRFARSKALLKPLAGVAVVIGALVLTRLHYFEVVLRSRIQTGGGSTSVHFDIYDFIPKILSMHPLFGLGLNNFSVYYEEVTGKSNWGPHSFYVALIVETGLVGATLFAVFIWYLFRRLGTGRRIGELLALLGDPAAARVRPLAWGLTAALAATLAGNLFYLTMSFYYFYAFAVLALSAPVVFSRRLARALA